MKKIVSFFGVLLLILNILSLLIFDNYNTFNFWLVTFSIISTTIFLFISNSKENKDAQKISLTFVYSLIGILLVLLSLKAPTGFKNNMIVFILIGIIIIELLIMIVSQYIRKHI